MNKGNDIRFRESSKQEIGKRKRTMKRLLKGRKLLCRFKKLQLRARRKRRLNLRKMQAKRTMIRAKNPKGNVTQRLTTKIQLWLIQQLNSNENQKNPKNQES